MLIICIRIPYRIFIRN